MPPTCPPFALTSISRGTRLATRASISSRRGSVSVVPASVIASSDADLEGILSRSAEVLGTLAERRSDISSLLAATNDLAENLGLLVRAVRGTVDLGVADLNSILLTAEGELDTIEVALSELRVAQEMFARPLSFGRFVEGHACAVTTADTCVPFGSPEDAVTPQHGVQPIPDPRLE